MEVSESPLSELQPLVVHSASFERFLFLVEPVVLGGGALDSWGAHVLPPSWIYKLPLSTLSPTLY